MGAEAPKKEPGGMVENLKAWQEKMSDTFRDAFRGAGKENSGHSAAGTVSVDFREQNDSYMLRLDLPNRSLDKVEVSFAGETLRVTAPAEGAAQKYEQAITLQDVLPDAAPVVERKQEQGIMVVTVPKVSAKSEVTSAPLSPPGPPLYLARDTEIMQQMEQMRRDMDRVFEDYFNPLRFLPSYKDVFDEYRFGSTYNLEDKGDGYEIRIFLPDRAMKNVTASVDGRILQVEAKAEQSSSAHGIDDGLTTHKAAYTQRITLPGPVNKAKMKIEKKEGMIVVALPKAGTL